MVNLRHFSNYWITVWKYNYIGFPIKQLKNKHLVLSLCLFQLMAQRQAGPKLLSLSIYNSMEKKDLVF